MLAGAILYMLGSFACVLAAVLPLFLAGRIVQAVGGAFLLSVGRTIIADLSNGPETGRRMAVLGMISLLSPTFAPLLGSVVADLAGWRAIMWLLAAFGLIGLVGTAAAVPVSRRAATGVAVDPFHGFRRLLARWAFWRFSLAVMATSTGIFGFYAASSFVLIDIQGLSGTQSGIAYLLMAGAATFGAFRATRTRRDPMRTGSILYGCGAAILIVATTLSHSAVALILPMMIVSVGTGRETPAGLASAVRTARAHAGSASSLIGAFQMAAAAIATTTIAALFRPSVSTAVLPIVGTGAVLLVLLFARRNP